MIEFLKDILFELKHVPGLGFLEKYYSDLESKHHEFGEKVEDLENMVEKVEHGGKVLKDTPRNIKGSKRSS